MHACFHSFICEENEENQAVFQSLCLHIWWLSKNILIFALNSVNDQILQQNLFGFNIHSFFSLLFPKEWQSLLIRTWGPGTEMLGFELLLCSDAT